MSKALVCFYHRSSSCGEYSVLVLLLSFKLFDAQVVPILLYFSEIWGFKQCQNLQRDHLFAYRKILHVPTTTASDVVYCELGGRFSLFMTSALAMRRVLALTAKTTGYDVF